MMAKNGALKPEQQLEILARIWNGDGEGKYVFLPWIDREVVFADPKATAWKESQAFAWPEDRDKILNHLRGHTTHDLYFSVNKFLAPHRSSQQVGENTCLYADLDPINPRTDVPRNMKPSIAWETSPGRFQCVWLLSDLQWDASDVGGLNHRLSLSIGADKSGWDMTQVLRVPGRPNWKKAYRDEDGRPAPGQLLWFSDKRYDSAFFDQELPEAKHYGAVLELDDAEIDGIDREAVWARVRLNVSATVRQYMGMKSREILGSDHDRSEVIWQIERDLADAGCSIAEIIALVRHTSWNKYAGRPSELSQLRSEAAKAIGVREEDAAEPTLENPGEVARHPGQPTWLSSILEQPLPRPSWLVRNVWAKGSCGFISGEPKSYKSYFGLDMAISVATGTAFLNDPQFSTVQSNVLYLQEEDSLPLVMKRAAQILEQKAPDRFWHGQLSFDNTTHDDASGSRSGTLSELVWTPPGDDIPLAMHIRNGFIVSKPDWQVWLANFVQQHNFSLVVIDTLGTTIGEIDIMSPIVNDRVLKPLKVIAEHCNCAIAIVHHNRKPNDNGKARSGQQMLGSTAFHAWVESALYVRKGEIMTGKPTEVYVERENKLAEDLKFRVVIPTMFEDKGDGDGKRQMWEPEIKIGWGDAENKEGDVELIKEESGKKKSTAGFKIAQMFAYLGEDSYTLDELITNHPDAKENRRKPYQNEINDAVANGYLTETDFDVYKANV